MKFLTAVAFALYAGRFAVAAPNALPKAWDEDGMDNGHDGHDESTTTVTTSVISTTTLPGSTVTESGSTFTTSYTSTLLSTVLEPTSTTTTETVTTTSTSIPPPITVTSTVPTSITVTTSSTSTTTTTTTEASAAITETLLSTTTVSSPTTSTTTVTTTNFSVSTTTAPPSTSTTTTTTTSTLTTTTTTVTTSAGTCTPTQIASGDFDGDNSVWTIQSSNEVNANGAIIAGTDTEPARSGTNLFRAVFNAGAPDGTAVALFQTLNVCAGQTYDITGFVRNPSANNCTVSYVINDTAIVSFGGETQDWTQLTADFTAPADTVTFVVFFTCPSADLTSTVNLYFDDVSISGGGL